MISVVHDINYTIVVDVSDVTAVSSTLHDLLSSSTCGVGMYLNKLSFFQHQQIYSE